jgi:hypothetical protein
MLSANPHCDCACALIAHASHFVMAVEVSPFLRVSAAPRCYGSDVSSVMLRACFYAWRPLLAIAVRVQVLHVPLSFSLAVDDRSVLYSNAPLRLRCSDVQQLRASRLLRCLAPTTRCDCACALIAHASHFVMAVEVRPFLRVSAAPRCYGSDLCSSVMLRACFYARRPLLAVAVRVESLHRHRSV